MGAALRKMPGAARETVLIISGKNRGITFLGGIITMDQTIVVQYSLIASALIAAVAAFAAAFSDSKVASHAIDGMTRQPEIQGQLFTSMLVGIGLVESIPIIAIVISLVLVFANPFLG